MTEAGRGGGLFSMLIPNWPLPPGVRSGIAIRSDSAAESDQAFEPLLGLPPTLQNAGNLEDVSPGARQDDVLSFEKVRLARARLAKQLDLTLSPQWLRQEHGVTVVEASASGRMLQADASFSRQPGLACVVLSADCLPLLLSSKDGSLVAAIHGGWRGLAKGIIGAALKTMDADPGQMTAYLGPAISSQHFEVGPEVRKAFLNMPRTGSEAKWNPEEVMQCFRPSRETDNHYFADLYALTRIQLKNLGVLEVYGGEYCTYAQSSLFYSHRRNRDVGRIASLIWIKD